MNAPTPPFIVGLTGGIASGKSTAAQAFREQGVTVLDADQISRQVVEPGRAELTQIAEHFGNHILQADGTLDRAALRTHVFENDDERRWLEQLLHPAIRQEFHTQTLAAAHSATSAYVIWEVALLVEGLMRQAVNRILVIDVPASTQLARLCARDGMTETAAKRMLAAQADRQTRLKFADDVLDNTQTLAQLHHTVTRLHQQYIRLSQDHPQNAQRHC